MEALRRVARLRGGAFVTNLWVTDSGALELERRFLRASRHGPRHDAGWSAQANNVRLVLRAVVEYRRCRLQLAEALEAEGMEVLDPGWDRPGAERARTVEEAVGLVQRCAVVPCSVAGGRAGM